MDQLFSYPTPLTVALATLALLAAGAVFWMARRKGPVLGPAWVAIGLLLVVAAIPLTGFLRSFEPYYVQVSVVTPPGTPPDRVKVWSSAQADSQRNGDAWEVRVSADSVPEDRTVLVWATLDPHDLTHSQAVTLKGDHHPKLTIRITGDRNSRIAGQIRDQDGKPVDEAMISQAGNPEGGVLSELNGTFTLPVDGEQGEQVEIQVAKSGKLKRQWVTAGDPKVVLTVDGAKAP